MTEYAVVDPASGARIKEYPTIDDAALDAAIGRAYAARESWGRDTSIADRAAAIARVAALHEERKDELAAIIAREMGKPVAQAAGEVEFSAAIYQYYADNAETFLAGAPSRLLDGSGAACGRGSPMGVLLGIMPWSYPY